ncbi:hypothetical protein [Methylobacterium brachiatum]
MRASEQVFGAVVMLTVLLDVFLRGIHARIGTGILSPKLTRLTWRLFQGPPAGRYEPMVLAFHGPAIPLLLVLTRSGLLASDAGLIMQPERGTGVRASSGETPTDLVPPSTPAAAAFSIVGASDFAPHTAAIKTRPSKRRPRRPTTDVCHSLAMRLCCRGCFLAECSGSFPTQAVQTLLRPYPECPRKHLLAKLTRLPRMKTTDFV